LLDFLILLLHTLRDPCHDFTSSLQNSRRERLSLGRRVNQGVVSQTLGSLETKLQWQNLS
jgi:hypothetical protein